MAPRAWARAWRRTHKATPCAALGAWAGVRRLRRGGGLHGQREDTRAASTMLDGGPILRAAAGEEVAAIVGPLLERKQQHCHLPQRGCGSVAPLAGPRLSVPGRLHSLAGSKPLAGPGTMHRPSLACELVLPSAPTPDRPLGAAGHRVAGRSHSRPACPKLSKLSKLSKLPNLSKLLKLSKLSRLFEI
jgi:hypothetical protein